MDRKELTDLLVTSSECFNQHKYIPWWTDDFEKTTYWYHLFKEDTLQSALLCLAECGREELLAPVGSAGLTLFHLLVWHNFYQAAEQMLCDGRLTAADVNLPDHKGHGITPFLLACARGNLAMAKLLLAHGADGSLPDERGMNAYHVLAYPRFQNNLPAINSTCLEHCVEQRAEIARLLTCDINRKNNAGLTPLELLLSTSPGAEYTWPLTDIFLEKGAKTDYVDEEGQTLLMLARRNGHRTAALTLMEQCPELVNVADSHGVTPIQHAVNFHNQAMYLALIDHGASPAPQMDLLPLRQITSNVFCDVSDSNRDGLSIALYMAKKLIRQLDPDDDDELGEITYILHNALISDQEAHLLDVCGEAGIDFTLPVHYHGELLCLRDKCIHPSFGMGTLRKLTELGVDLDSAVVSGNTPANLLASMSCGEESFYEEAAKLFSKESMEQNNNGGEAAVHQAAEHGHTGMLKVMIEKNVDVNLTQDVPAESGITPLHLACSNGHVDAVKLLLEAGADDTMQNLKGETPAHFVLLDKKFGEPLKADVQAALLKELKHLDIPREDGRTPLMLLDRWKMELLPIFLERGADVNHIDNNGRTLLMCQPYKDMAKELLCAGADLSLADNEGNTALHYALKKGAEGDARYLVKKGADYNHANNQGETPAQIAAEKGYETLMALMTDIR